MILWQLFFFFCCCCFFLWWIPLLESHTVVHAAAELPMSFACLLTDTNLSVSVLFDLPAIHTNKSSFFFQLSLCCSVTDCTLNFKICQDTQNIFCTKHSECFVLCLQVLKNQCTLFISLLFRGHTTRNSQQPGTIETVSASPESWLHYGQPGYVSWLFLVFNPQPFPFCAQVQFWHHTRAFNPHVPI